MVQIDVPAAFVASMFFIDLGKRLIKSDVEKSSEAKPAVCPRY